MFYANIYDPALILAQILLLQSSFYLIVSTTLLILFLLFNSSLTLATILAPSQLLFQGWPAIAAFIVVGPILSVDEMMRMNCENVATRIPMGSEISSSLLLPFTCSGYLLLPIVGRAKQCLDFSLTVYLLHFLCCLMYEGLPRTWSWWIVNAIACIACVMVGEYLCLKKELEAIPSGVSATDERDAREARERRSREQHALNDAAAAAHETQGLMSDEEMGDARGVTTTTIRLAPSNVYA